LNAMEQGFIWGWKKGVMLPLMCVKKGVELPIANEKKGRG